MNSLLWGVALPLSYIWDAWCLKVNANFRRLSHRFQAKNLCKPFSYRPCVLQVLLSSSSLIVRRSNGPCKVGNVQVLVMQFVGCLLASSVSNPSSLQKSWLFNAQPLCQLYIRFMTCHSLPQDRCQGTRFCRLQYSHLFFN